MYSTAWLALLGAILLLQSVDVALTRLPTLSLVTGGRGCSTSASTAVLPSDNYSSTTSTSKTPLSCSSSPPRLATWASTCRFLSLMLAVNRSSTVALNPSLQPEKKNESTTNSTGLNCFHSTFLENLVLPLTPTHTPIC